MKKTNRIISSLMLGTISLASFAQGYTMKVDGTDYRLKDGATILLSEAEDGQATLYFNSEDKTLLIPAKSISFDPSVVESSYQNLLNSLEYNYYQTTDGFGYGSIMVARDAMTADVIRSNNGYNWFGSLYENVMLPNYRAIAHYWKYYFNSISYCNRLINALESLDKRTEEQDNYLAVGYAFRALNYLDLARMYEYLPTDATLPVSVLGKNLTYLTVPIVTDVFSIDDKFISDSPRATRQEMKEFILSDLEKAERLMPKANVADKRFPGYVAVLGLKARLGMWVEDYQMALQASGQAINLGYNSPLSESEILDVQNGFNTLSPSSWIWGVQPSYSQGLNSWGSWMSGENLDGYVGVNLEPTIPVSLYSRIGDNDPRKLLYKVSGNEPHQSDNYYSLSSYASLKFRVKENDYALAAYPLMRIEELILINAEALVRCNYLNPGKTALEEFVQKHRDSSYECPGNTAEEVIDAIFEQKRIELWGEGQIFFDYKRLNKSVDRTLPEDEWPDSYAFKTTARPAWMNVVFPASAYSSFTGLNGAENPSTNGLYAQNGGYTVGTPEVDAYFTDGILSDLIGDNGLIRELKVKIKSSQEGREITIENPYKDLISQYASFISFTDSTNTHQLRFNVNDSLVSIPEQQIGVKFKGIPVSLKSVQNGVVRNGVITFPKNSIAVVLLGQQTIVNKNGQFCLRLNVSGVNNGARIGYYGSFYPGKNQWQIRYENGKKQIRIKFYPENVDKIRVGAMPLNYNNLDSYIDSIASGRIEYSTVGADSTAWITIPDNVNDCYLLAVGSRNGSIVATQTISLNDIDPTLCDFYYFTDMTDPDGNEMAKFQVWFHGYVKQGYVALVKESMTDAQVLDAWKQNSLPGIYKVKMEYSSRMAYAFPHYPAKMARYRLAVIGEMQDGSVQILRTRYEDHWFSVHPSVNLRMETQYYPDSIGTIAYVEYRFQNAPSKLRYELIDADSNETIYSGEPSVSANEYAVSFNPQPGVAYMSVLTALDQDGDLLEQVKSNPRVLVEDYVVVATLSNQSEFWEETNPVTLEYSAKEDMYRISNWLLGGTITFRWDRNTNQITMAEDMYATGFLYSNEYMTYANAIAPDCTFRYEDGSFYFIFRFDVPGLGTFGYYMETFSILEE